MLDNASKALFHLLAASRHLRTVASRYGMRHERAFARRFIAGELDNPSFAGIAKAMGAEGIVVDRLEDVGTALKRAVDLQMNGRKTTVLEIMCTRELGDPFRRDALAMPIRMLDKYKDYT